MKRLRFWKKKVTEENIEELCEPRFRRICKERKIPFIPFVFTERTAMLFRDDMYESLDREYINFCEKFSKEYDHDGNVFLI